MREERIVSEEYDEERLDRFLTALLDGRSRSFLQELIKSGAVSVEGRVAKAAYRVRLGERVVVELPEDVLPHALPEDIPLDVVYEDDDLIVVNKPKGMVVHPAPGHPTGTLVNALLYHCQDLSGINGVLRPGIVHRIDRDTTGLLLVCKNDMSHQAIAEQLKAHSIERTYEALALGAFPACEGTIDAPIGRDPKERKRMAVRSAGEGKSAITHYEVIAQYEKLSHVRCRLQTGRTHQIRVHLSHIGHPVLGDEVYGGVQRAKALRVPGFATQGQALHAKTLGFSHPRTGAWMQFDSQLPAYFDAILQKLQAGIRRDEGVES